MNQKERSHVVRKNQTNKRKLKKEQERDYRKSVKFKIKSQSPRSKPDTNYS